MLDLGSMSLSKSLLDLTVFIGIYFIDKLLNKTNSSKKKKKTLTGNFWSVNESIGNKFTARFTDIQSAQKKLPASFGRYFSREVCHITNRNIVCNFISVFICPSIYQLVNITYY
jgi:hypothetical protein